ncbi:MAG: PQQ-binding-like beta-propeller repeat protein [Cyclobacteriaceae bacterium]
MKQWGYLLFTVIAVVFSSCDNQAEEIRENNPNNWSEYLGGPDRNHYSPLTQITPENVSQLQVAWTYHTTDSGQMQTNPLIIDGVLYGVTPTLQAFALDAATGEERWIFGESLRHWSGTSRGVAYWSEGQDRRVFYTIGSSLWAIHAVTGAAIPDFGDQGRIDLHQGLPEGAQDKFMMSTTPGTIFEDLIIMPVRVSEGPDAAPGDIRAFDVRTGELVWTFHTIPYPGEEGYETFPKDAYLNTYLGGANNWAGMAVDHENGMLFVPTGSVAADFYGGNRPGQNLFSDCLLALDARTGERIWHFQTTHHDIWDRDLPAPPNLMTLTQEGKRIEVVAQVTKQGYVFVFDRKTGAPIFPIEEMPFPASKLQGEKTWPTQPIPTRPVPFARQSKALTDDDISPYAENREELIVEFHQYEGGEYMPGSLEGAVLLPGYDGGAEWGGAAADPEGTLYVNANEMAWIHQMTENTSREELEQLSEGSRLYANHCITCHGENLEGNTVSNYPSLLNIPNSRDREFVDNIIKNGKGMMPGFTTLSTSEVQAIIAFLYGEEKQEALTIHSEGAMWLPYRHAGYNKFLDNRGFPAISPPWGTLTAIDLNTGAFTWQVPLGHEPILAEQGIKDTGVENYGGPVVTASGLLFIAATKDGYFRAFNKTNGELLWETKLPFASFATPSTYMVNGKQFIVLACGGTKLGTAPGNLYVAFALPTSLR